MSTIRNKVYPAVLAIGLFAAPMAYSAGGDVGFGGGGSIYINRTVTSPAGDATVGLKPGFAVSGWLGQNLYPLIGGELRYTFEKNDLKLNAPGTGEYTFSGQSHSIHYDLLIHGAPVGSPVRPFVAVGGGVKGYYGTGEETPNQPGQTIVILSKTSEWKPLVVFGGGVKFKASDSVEVRVEVYDYFSQVPNKVIAPAPGAEFSGWFHNFVPSVGISFRF